MLKCRTAGGVFGGNQDRMQLSEEEDHLQRDLTHFLYCLQPNTSCMNINVYTSVLTLKLLTNEVSTYDHLTKMKGTVLLWKPRSWGESVGSPSSPSSRLRQFEVF